MSTLCYFYCFLGIYSLIIFYDQSMAYDIYQKIIFFKILYSFSKISGHG